jgi:hypothetical protein
LGCSGIIADERADHQGGPAGESFADKELKTVREL